ncbi:MAG: PmbA protein [Clostridia bacterium]|nr:PmbA protein [Clostridia bacterium]
MDPQLEKDYLDLVVQVVEKAGKRGVMAEAYLSGSQELNIEVRDQEIEALTVASDRGLGLRVLAGGKVGFAYTTDLSPAALDEVVDRALANAGLATADPFNRLPGSPGGYPELAIYDPDIEATPVADKIEMARKLEREARAFDPRVKITESCCYRDQTYVVALANSQGVAASYRGAYCGLSLFVVAVEGAENQTGFSLQYTLRLKELDAARVGREAAARAVRQLGARRIETQKAAVVFDPYVASNFLSVLASSLTAEAVQKGKSLFKGRVGQKVASDMVSIIDDGRLAGGIATAPFDGEGVPTGRTVLIEGGILRGFLHNTYTAAREGVKSTGNGSRGSFKTTPEVGTTNFFIQPGKLSPEELLKDIERGFYVTEVMGMHTANPVSGDFSVGASGLLIEKGELTRPVRGVAIAGNLIGLLEAVDGVGNDLVFFGATGSPTLRIARMTISG